MAILVGSSSNIAKAPTKIYAGVGGAAKVVNKVYVGGPANSAKQVWPVKSNGPWFFHRGVQTMVSEDGAQWTAVSSTIGSNLSWNSGIYGAIVPLTDETPTTYTHVYIVNDISGYVQYSYDMTTWITVFTGSGSSYLGRMAYGNGVFVMVNGYGVASAAVGAMRYSHGVNAGSVWSLATSSAGAGYYWTDITYGNGRFVAVCSGSNSTVAGYSLNGIDWTITTLPASKQWMAITYGNGKFVAVSGRTSLQDTAAYSTDGITWSLATLPVASTWIGVAYGNGRFVAITGDKSSIGVQNSNTIAYSVDGGATWIQGTILPGVSATFAAITFGNGKFVAVAYRTPAAVYSNIAAYSVDGVTWTQVTLPYNNAYSYIANSFDDRSP